MLITTSSSTDTWAKCQALYDFRYNKLLQEKRPGKALLIGSAFHVGCESFWRGEPYGIAWAKVQDSLTNDWWLTDTGKLEMRKLASYLKGYYRRWEDDLRARPRRADRRPEPSHTEPGRLLSGLVCVPRGRT